jgi:hypothetical protein
MRSMTRVAVVGSLLGGLVVAVPLAAQAVTVTQGSGYYTFSNNFGNYRIYYQCSPADHTGPGYIAQWQTPTGTYLLNEPAAAGTSYDDASGGSATTLGLGKFVFRDFRQGDGTPVFGPSTPTEGTISGGAYTTPPNSWPITGAMCASSNTYSPTLNNAYDPAEIIGGRGVTAAVIDQAPVSVLSGTAIQFGITVTFGDYYNADILRVRYIWRFYDTQVKMWARVAIDCSSQPCMAGSGNTDESLYVKGPKYVAGINGSASSSTPGFTRIVDFTSNVSTPTIATNLSGGLCMYTNTDPSVSTNKCSDNDRTRIRFDYGTSTSRIDGGCAANTTPCLNAIFRAYGNNDNGLTLTPDDNSHPWEGSGFGIDQWALAAANLPAAVPNDNNTCALSGTSPSDQGSRQWELVGYKNSAGVYEAAASYYFAWLDCTKVATGGAFYRPVPLNSSWGTYANFAFNSNWTTSYN